MRQKRIIKTVLGAGLVLSFGIWGQYIISTSTTMGTTTELAGISYTLDQYCSVQTGGNQSDPEAIVAFEDTIANMNGTTIVSGTAVGEATPQPTEQATATATPKPESEYANVGISIAADYVNIRKKPSTEAEIVGKLYRGSAATIMKHEGDWVYIKSGSVSGYIMKDYLAIGYSAEKLIDDFGTKWATVTTETLKVREEKNTDCTVLTLIPEDESYEVLREETEWAKIRVDGDTVGYVSKDYVKISVQFKKAVSIEEEREEERRKAAAAAAERERQQSQTSSSSSNSGSSNSGSSNSGSSNSSGSSGSSSSRNSGSSSSNGSGSGGSSSGGSSSNGSGGSSSGGGGGSSNGSGGSTGGGGSSSNGSGGSVLGSGDGSAVASYALKFVGNPYVYGGSSLTHGTDCSGFTMSVFKNFGISLPRTSGEQSRVGKKISVSSARAGDLIFYASGGRVNHVALCIGGGRVVHASNPRTGITTSNMYYRTPYCARRVLG
ncbi:MAG: C40 family peptidase [Lachnospiraceae bacterium]|nr:C40 family peptidase [Lachnospiraceae bacterium]